MRSNLLIYGVTGALGGLVSALAADAGLPHLAAGRDLERVEAHADRLLVPGRTFSLSDPAKVDRGLAGVAVLLNAAGPFAETAPALVEACLRGGVHYLDLATEVNDLETVRRLDARAREAGVMLLPGLGFGMVPADAMAARLRRRLPDAVRLRLAFETAGGLPAGALERLRRRLGSPGFRRLDGELVAAAPAAQRRTVDLGGGAREAVLDPWRGDVVTAYWSSVYDAIEAYAVYPAPLRALLRLARGGGVRRLLGGGAARRVLGLGDLWRSILGTAPSRAGSSGTTAAERRASLVWAEAEDAAGDRAVGRLRGPEASLLTARVALWAVQRVLAGRVRVGFQTAVTAWGPDLVDRLAAEVEGIEVHWS